MNERQPVHVIVTMLLVILCLGMVTFQLQAQETGGYIAFESNRELEPV